MLSLSRLAYESPDPRPRRFRPADPSRTHPERVDSYVSGFALQELTLPFDTPGELAEAAESIVRQFPAHEYPHLAETITEHVTKSGYDYADEFEVGLDLILDGLERLRETA